MALEAIDLVIRMNIFIKLFMIRCRLWPLPMGFNRRMGLNALPKGRILTCHIIIILDPAPMRLKGICRNLIGCTKGNIPVNNSISINNSISTNNNISINNSILIKNYILIDD